MASLIYPEFERIIRVSHPDGNNGYDIATEIGDSGNITRWVEHAEFTLAPEFGCCEGRLVMVAFDDDRSTIKLNNPFLLSFGDLVEFIPETGADPYYAGIVVPPRTNEGDWRHGYTLAGLANQLYGIPPVASGTTTYSGIYVSHGGDGVVQLLNADAGPMDIDVGIIRTTTAVETNMVYNAGTQVQSLIIDPTMNLADIFQDLARHCNDDIAGHASYPWPVFWGVDNERTFYFNFRPDTQLMQVSFLFNPLYREGTPVVTIGSTVVKCQRVVATEGSEFRNSLLVRGGTDSEGAAIEKRYENAASIAYYKFIKQDVQELPEIRNTFDADRFASGYFQRYAMARSNYSVEGVPITKASGLPLPWLGYAAVVTPDQSGDASEFDITEVRVTFDETPIADFRIGHGSQSSFSGVGGSPRWPGNASKKTADRIPRSRNVAAGASVTPGSTDPYWIYAVGYGSSI